MTNFDAWIAIVLSLVLIVGGYQFYFLPQKYSRKPIVLRPFSLDERIPFKPGWVWIYSGLYYPIILIMVFTLDSVTSFCRTAFNFLILLMMHIVLSFLFPVRTPPAWRDFNTNENISTKFLSFVHHFDKSGNCFPSMHVAVAVLTSIYLQQNMSLYVGAYSYFSYSFVVAIAISVLFTKQHYIVDVPAGIALGCASFAVYNIML